MEYNGENDQKTILIVEDEPSIVEILVYNLKKEGYNTLEATDGKEAVDMVFKYEPDLILLDWMLPKMNGISVCQKVRTKYNMPILMLTARNEEIDKILGLELGADDYITKPFSVRELMARIKANLRKVDLKTETKKDTDTKEESNEIEKILTVGPLSLDLEKIEAKIGDKNIKVTLKEFEVLKYLALRKGQVVTREELLKKVWGYDLYPGEKRNIDVFISRMRKEIDKTGAPGAKILVTKRGVGYFLSEEQFLRTERNNSKHV